VVGAIIGIVLSELGSFFVMFVYLKRNRPVGEHEITIEYKDILKEILPFATTSLILPISSFIDSLLVVNLLEINFNGNVPTFLYGLESGAVSSLVSLPTIVSFSVASVILPNITLRERKFNRDKNLANALKIVLVITVPCVLCFLLFPNRLVALLYGTKFNITNINGTILASRLIAISGIGVLFLAVNQIFSMCLQGVDMRFNAVRNIIIAVVGKFVIECLFLPSKQLNIYALAVANTTCYLLAMVLNYFDLKTSFKIKIDYMFWVKLLIANIIMLIFAIGTFSVEITNLNTILGLIVAVIVYLLMLYYLNIIGKDKAMIKYKI